MMIESRQASQSNKLRSLVNKKLEGDLAQGITSFMKNGSFSNFFKVKSRSFRKSAIKEPQCLPLNSSESISASKSSEFSESISSPSCISSFSPKSSAKKVKLNKEDLDFYFFDLFYIRRNIESYRQFEKQRI